MQIEQLVAQVGQELRCQASRPRLKASLQAVAQAILHHELPPLDLWELAQARDETGSAVGPEAEIRRVVFERRALLPAQQAPWQALLAHPPLALFLRVCELLGCISLEFSPSDRTIQGDGAIARRDDGLVRALAWPAFRRLLQTVHSYRQLAAVQFSPARQEYPTRFDELWHALHSQGLMEVQGRIGEAATWVGFLGWELERAQGDISFGQRLKFWSRTPAKEREGQLKPIFAHALRQLNEEAQRLWEVAVRADQAAPAALLRDLFVQLHGDCEQLHTRSGTYDEAVSCEVNGKERASSQLREVRSMVAMLLPWMRSRETLLRELASPSGQHPELVRLRQHLVERGEIESLKRIAELEQERWSIDRDKAQVDSQIGLWERVNFLKETPKKQESGRLAALSRVLGDELRQREERVWSCLLQAQPALQLVPATENLHRRLEQVQAVCRSSRQGDRTVYRCEVVGRDELKKALRDWGRAFHSVYGPGVGACQWLELIELRRGIHGP